MKFEKPFVEIIRFESEDVIATSGGYASPSDALNSIPGFNFSGNLNSFKAPKSWTEDTYTIGDYTFKRHGSSKNFYYAN